MNMKLKGIVPPIGTPLTHDERVDETGLRTLVRYLLNAGVHGIFANGTMGIFALLTDSEQMRVVEIVVDEVDRKVPVIAGVSDTGTKRVIEKAKSMQRIGVDYLTTLPSFYYALTRESATRFYRDVAQAVQKPLLIYNNPILTKVNIGLDAVVELSRETNVVGIKETGQDCNRWIQLIEAFRARDDFSILLGTELLAPIGLMLGADGIIGGSHNVAPKVAVELYQAINRREYESAFELSRRLSRLCKIFDFGEVWGGFEAALQYLGICEKATAKPYTSIEPEERQRVVAILKECGIQR